MTTHPAIDAHFKMTARKQALRKQALTARAKINKADAQDAAQAITDHLLTHIPLSAKIIAGYWPMRGEIDVVPLFRHLAARDHILCLPVIVEAGEPLIFREWKMGDELVRGRHGIPMPPVTHTHLSPDIVIAPLVAFDADGNRLGYGAGYYDRTIRQLRNYKENTHVVGAAYSSQQVDSIPADFYDQKLDAVATEKGIRYFT